MERQRNTGTDAQHPYFASLHTGYLDPSQKAASEGEFAYNRGMLRLKNDRFIRALLRQPVDRTPVWIMRQAGRYLPEYRQLREKVPNFMAFCKTPELACEATLQPLRRFPLDAAIIFSDILTIPDAMGVDLHIAPTVGPVIRNPVRSAQDVNRLQMPAVEEALSYLFDAIRLTVKALDHRVPLIGFAGSPWTLACYMTEGQSSKTFLTARAMLYQQPDVFHTLLQKLTTLTIAYLNAQIKAGADVVMLFDTWGGLLTPSLYRQFSLDYLSQIAAEVVRQKNGRKIPLIFFTKNGGQWLESIANSGCDAVGLDWTTDIGQARRRVGDRVALQGNLDPAILLSNPESISTAAVDILKSYGQGFGHVFNLGHGIDPSTPIENVAALVEAVQNFSIKNEKPISSYYR